MSNSEKEKQARLNIASILLEEETLCVRYQQAWASLEEAKQMALSQIKNKYSQHDL